MRKLICIVPAVLLSFSFVDATSPIPKLDTSPRTEEARKLQSHFVEIRTSDDPAAVEAEKHEAIDLACEYLSGGDQEVRAEVLQFLGENTTTINLAGIDKCTPVPSGEDVYAVAFRSALDRSQLFFLEESEKRDILHKCMRKGKLTLWRGTGLNVAACVGEAAWDGVPELETDIEYAYHNSFDDRLRSIVPLELMIAIHTIMKGPGTGWDQWDDVTDQILAMSDTGLGLKLEEDKHFRTVALGLLRSYCSSGKKTTCNELRSGIESAVHSVASNEDGTPVAQISGWWQCALYEYGTFTPAPNPSEQSMDELIEAAIGRSLCDSWSPNR